MVLGLEKVFGKKRTPKIRPLSMRQYADDSSKIASEVGFEDPYKEAREVGRRDKYRFTRKLTSPQTEASQPSNGRKYRFNGSKAPHDKPAAPAWKGLTSALDYSERTIDDRKE